MVINLTTPAPTVPAQPQDIEPQDIETMQARFDLALEKDWSVEEVVVADGPRAGADPACIFDFLFGLRLIVSFDLTLFGLPPILHLSGSVRQESLLKSVLMKLPHNKRMGYLINMVTASFELISHRHISAWQLVSSDGGIPHLFGPTREEYFAI